ncbi:hypothetical protein DENSPDRAFT_810607 [Dentipellis sp. KUC8613]|nr:hypothetical protein DENSPDRAFT_810607 [Dentipellis sp. KUC8613]
MSSPDVSLEEHERIVEVWLQTLPQSCQEEITELKNADPAVVRSLTADFLQDTIRKYVFPKSAFKCKESRSDAWACPVLRDAFWGRDGLPKPFRTDLEKLHSEVPLARFLLLACVGMSLQTFCVSAQQRKLREGWNQEYRGTAPIAFEQALHWYEKNYDSRIHSGRAIAIIQSSGSGKSRLVDELSKKYPTFCVFFQTSKDATAGWPPGDPLALKFFNDLEEANITYIGHEEQIRAKEMAAAFLGALIGELADEWKVHLPMTQFYGHHGIPNTEARLEFFRRVHGRANRLLLDHKNVLNEERRWINELSLSPHDSERPEEEVKTHSPQWHRKLFSILCRGAFVQLGDILKGAGHSKFFLSLDRCTILGQAPAAGRTPLPRMTLVAMQRIIKAADYELGNHPVCFWFLLLDTSPSVITRFPSGLRSAFFRPIANLQPLPPFTHLGFNQLMDRMPRQKASDSFFLENLKFTGRPLWSTETSCEVLDTAKQKLFSSPVFDSHHMPHVLAAFAFRVCLAFVGNDAARDIASDAVDHHMCLLTSVIGTTLITQAPSEPILAIAAADALNVSHDGYDTALANLFEELHHQYPAHDPTDAGKLCARVLLCLARDRTTIQSNPGFVDSKTFPAKREKIHAIELAELLQTLLGGEDPSLGFTTEKEKALAQELLAFCRHKWVNFTHFIRLERHIDDLSTEELEHAWFFNAAIQCCHNQAVIDGGIVCYGGSLDEPFDRLNLFLIPYQTKARTRSTGAASRAGLGLDLTAPPILHPKHDGSGSERFKPPTIVLLMDLKSKSTSKENDKTRLELRAAHATTRWEGHADPARGETEPRNYFISVRGCSSAQYPVLKHFPQARKAILGVFATQPTSEWEAIDDVYLDEMCPLERLGEDKRGDEIPPDVDGGASC